MRHYSTSLGYLLLGGLAAFSCLTAPVMAQVFELEIETRIEATDAQAGMKSKQRLSVSFVDQDVSSQVETGVTNIGPIRLDSIRDNFQVRNISFQGNTASFTVEGETASGVGVMPNINYKFDIVITRQGKGHLSGCHDGYPSYRVKVGSNSAYEYVHPSGQLGNLFGSCDIKITAPQSF